MDFQALGLVVHPSFASTPRVMAFLLVMDFPITLDTLTACGKTQPKRCAVYLAFCPAPSGLRIN